MFDNKTTDKVKKAEQVQKLLSLVDSVVIKNNGKPFTDELFHELQVNFSNYSFICFEEENSNCDCISGGGY